MHKQSVEMLLEISPYIDDKLNKMSKQTRLPRNEVLKRAIFLMDIAIQMKKDGNKLAIVNSSGKTIDEIYGI